MLVSAEIILYIDVNFQLRSTEKHKQALKGKRMYKHHR